MSSRQKSISQTAEFWQLTKKSFAERSKHLLETSLHSDCELLVCKDDEKKLFRVHKIILALGSPVFEAMLFGAMAEANTNLVTISDLEPSIFRDLLEFLYTGQVQLSSFSQSLDLYYAAEKYMLLELVDKCREFIISENGMKIETCSEALQLAILFNDTTLKERTLAFILCNINNFLLTPTFEEISEPALVLIVKENNRLNFDNRLALNLAIKRWGNKECSRRQLELNSQNVRLVLENIVPHFRLSPKEELIMQIAEELDCDPSLVQLIDRDVHQGKPNVGWESITGLTNAKGLFQEAAIMPNTVPDCFKSVRRPCKGVLLVGPPNTDKTLFANAVATEYMSTFFKFTSSTLTSLNRDEPEKVVKILFHMAKKLGPSIIFIDDVDALVTKKSASNDHKTSMRLQSELLVQMDCLQGDGPDLTSAEQRVLVLAASNHPWLIDEAFLRRFEKRVYIPLSDGQAREKLLRSHLMDIKLDPNLNLSNIAEMLEGYSEADIMCISREAVSSRQMKDLFGAQPEQISPPTFGMPIHRPRFEMSTERYRPLFWTSTEQNRKLTKADYEESVTTQDFVDAIKRSHGTVTGWDVAAYKNWIKEFGSSE